MDTPSRILSIEDEDLVRQSMVARLGMHGYEMIEACDGREGLEIFRREKPDLVLCDLGLPEVDGFEVLEVISRISPDTPVIVVSGTADLGDAMEAVKLGACDFIAKPIFDMAVVTHAVDKALERVRLIRENQEYRQHLERTNKRLKESIRLLEEDETAARHIQFQLLPEPHARWNGFEFSHFLRTSTLLSGDFLDYFQIDDKRVGFYIADVSGHGVSSAFVTVVLKSLMNHLLDEFRHSRSDAILHPNQVLQFVNEDIVHRDFNKYLTMFYTVLDEEQRTMTFSNGGQFPPPILFDGKNSRFISDRNLPVGLFAEAEFESCTLDLPDSFVLALSSDGVLEVLAQEHMKDKESFLLEKVHSLDITIEQLVDVLGLEASEAPIDDITLLLAKKGN